MPRTKRSNRKALRDLTNNSTLLQKSFTKMNYINTNTNNNKSNVELEEKEDEHLDRLLLIHSNLTSLILQETRSQRQERRNTLPTWERHLFRRSLQLRVDELVAGAIKAPNEIGRKEIESLTLILSEMQSSLKPWPLRFQKALSTHSNGSENNLNPSMVSETVYAGEDIRDVVQSPEESKFDSMISPSPLVAWRGDCNADGGRQLFLLTPLPRPKVLSSNPRGYLKSAFEKMKSDNGLQPHMGISKYTNDDMLESREIKPTPGKISDFFKNKREGTKEPEYGSPPKYSLKECPGLVFTPRMKMSPPKSCVLLEPISEMAYKSYGGVRKPTPFPVGLQRLSGLESSESSSGGKSEDFTLKYPELFGIQPNYQLGNGRKGLESSPDWFMSPPKSCVLMEPSDEKLLTDAIKNYPLSRADCVPDQPENVPSEKRDDSKEFKESCTIVESTPMFKEPESSYRVGNRPGENTLKKELWTKFEEASTNDFRFDVSVLQTTNKGFLDRLEEVSVEEKK